MKKSKPDVVTHSEFGLTDYFDMLRYDVRTPFVYFFERHIFDILHKTDTHKRLLVEDYSADVGDLEHVFNHSCGWTSTIDKSLRYVTNFLGDESLKFSFVDVGSGKGKVLLVCAGRNHVKEFRDIAGVEINSDLVHIARSNFQKMALAPCRMFTGSAQTLNLGDLNENLVLYLYNPFDEVLLADFLVNQTFKRCVIVYNNPVYSEVVESFGFTEIYRRQSFSPTGRVSIFENT